MATVAEIRELINQLHVKEGELIAARNAAIDSLNGLCNGADRWYNSFAWTPGNPFTGEGTTLENVTGVAILTNSIDATPRNILTACRGDEGRRMYDRFVELGAKLRAGQTLTDAEVQELSALGELINPLNAVPNGANTRFKAAYRKLIDSVNDLATTREQIRTAELNLNDVQVDSIVQGAATSIQAAVVDSAVNTIVESYKQNRTLYLGVAILIVALIVISIISKKKPAEKKPS